MGPARLVKFKDLEQISFKEAWDYQSKLHAELVERKLKNRKAKIHEPVHHYLILCEHNPVFTLGKSGSMDHLLLDNVDLEKRDFEFFKINRGGDITYHGPGQITGYPIFDLDHFFTDVHKYVRFLEEIIIRTLDHYGVKGKRIEGYTGVWIKDSEKDTERKICAIGVHLSRWVTMHGFAFNVNTDLSHFDHIIPCGISEANMEVTSLEKELNKSVNIEEVKLLIKNIFADLFELKYEES